MGDTRVPDLIHLFGPDGAGKSTHMRILASYLSGHAIQVRKCWVRAPHTLAFLLWKLLVKIGFYREVPSPYGAAVRLPAVDRNRQLQFFWSIVEFIGVLPKILRVNYLIRKGYAIVAERYILDSVTTIAYFINDINFLRSSFARSLFSMIPKKTAFIFLDSDYETIFERRAPIAEYRADEKKGPNCYSASGSLESRNFINFQRRSYKMLAGFFDAFVVDTSKLSIDQVSRVIIEHLGLSDL